MLKGWSHPPLFQDTSPSTQALQTEPGGATPTPEAPHPLLPQCSPCSGKSPTLQTATCLKLPGPPAAGGWEEGGRASLPAGACPLRACSQRQGRGRERRWGGPHPPRRAGTGTAVSPEGPGEGRSSSSDLSHQSAPCRGRALGSAARQGKPPQRASPSRLSHCTRFT